MAERRMTSEERKRKTAAPKKKKKKVSWLKRIFLTIFFLGLALFIAGASLFAYYASTAPELDEELLKYPLSSEFYDINGEMFAKLGEENRTFVPYEDIPQEMINAIIATEDVRFFEHSGMDFWRLGGAVFANFRDGYGSQGASTITQQVVKNSFFKNEKKLKRKAQEAWLAFKLERAYSKEEIFEMYFNRVLMSGTVYGFGTAAKHFYGKELEELTLDEMAQLAGMPQSPNRFNPFNNPENAQKRRDIVLSLMVLHEKITQDEANAAKQIQVADAVLPEDVRIENSNMKYPGFVKIVLDELRENGDYELLSEGLKVYTTLDPKAQEAVESAMNNSANFPNETIQSGVAVVDTKTGEIRAVGGGRNYDRGLKFNRASDIAGRSPGSTAKPIVAYGPAIEKFKWSTGHTTSDEKMNYPNTSQTITNWDGKYNGVMTIRQALYSSRNVPAVKALIEVGMDDSKSFLNKLGIYPEMVVPSSALGPQINVTPIELASAYAAFGNNGLFTEGHAIKKVVYRDGKTEKNYKPKSNVAMSDYTAYMITDILRDTMSTLPGASGTNANISGVDIAGKTGTSNYSSDDFAKFGLPSGSVPDSWFSGYTTDYSISIWTGNDDYSKPMTTWDERRVPQNLFKAIMTSLVQTKSPSTFQRPDSVVEATIEVGTSPLKLASEFTPDDKKRTELFVKGTQPTEVSTEYKEPEIGTIMDLAAQIAADSKSIDVTWAYNAPLDASDDPVLFDVTLSTNGGAPVLITSTEGFSKKIRNIEPGNTYTITVTPKIKDFVGTGTSTTILVAETIEKPPTTIEDDEEEKPNNGNNNNGNNGNTTPPATGGGTNEEDEDTEDEDESSTPPPPPPTNNEDTQSIEGRVIE